MVFGLVFVIVGNVFLDLKGFIFEGSILFFKLGWGFFISNLVWVFGGWSGFYVINIKKWKELGGIFGENLCSGVDLVIVIGGGIVFVVV